ncbi:hypothetical protein [Marinobacter sp.]|jgi:hypothetical protein|uniref:hypothetical protein n=1 Tax=Marinobacter sp. TaxID=50741 RepID=UPI002609A86D|nr:hypothetical protein [Marinobacter sp.]|tara:strand:- start:930 stop:1127 length:198 start_codon:yes stop_codon:yes gene_type:complete
MIHTLKTFGARAAFLLVILAGLGFGFIAAAMSILIGVLLFIGIRLGQAPDDLATKSDARVFNDLS